MPKSSQAARNSCLSAARRSASRRRQAGSTLKKLNLAKVRSAAIALTIAVSAFLAATPGAAAEPRVELLQVPSAATVGQLSAAGFSPGLMSAGLGTVTPEQTYLDVGAGNRAFNTLYDGELAPLRLPRCRAWFEEARARAATAPDEIEPGLLVERLEAAGITVGGLGRPACALGVQIASGHGPAAFPVRDASVPVAAASARRGHVLVIAIAAPTGTTDQPIPIGIAGPGFDGDLTSDTTRTNGYVTSTDIAPTILEFFGIAVPTQMSGQPIRTEGSVDPAAIETRGARMAVVSHRRGPVIGLSLLAWVLAAALVALPSR